VEGEEESGEDDWDDEEGWDDEGGKWEGWEELEEDEGGWGEAQGMEEAAHGQERDEERSGGQGENEATIPLFLRARVQHPGSSAERPSNDENSIWNKASRVYLRISQGISQNISTLSEQGESVRIKSQHPGFGVLMVF
jgi:hypothetical protein